MASTPLDKRVAIPATSHGIYSIGCLCRGVDGRRLQSDVSREKGGREAPPRPSAEAPERRDRDTRTIDEEESGRKKDHNKAH
jgi:hypothetical protein